MDALDLTTGERLPGLKSYVKGSRRKASAPQRRHQSEENGKREEPFEDDSLEKTSTNVSEENNNSPDRSGSRVSTPRSDLDPDIVKNIPASNDCLLPTLGGRDSPRSLKDDGSLRFDASKILQRSGIFNFAQGQKYLFNMNNNSNGLKNESISEGSNGDHEDPKPVYKPASTEFPRSLLLPFPGSVDDLMQQRLRRYLDDVQPAEAPGIPERTKKQNRWAFNVWREWARKRNMLEDSFTGVYKGVPLDVGQANEEELDFWLCKFVMEIRRKDGNPYPPHTLMQIVMGIQRYLRQQAGKPSICILDRSNPTYNNFRSVLDYRIKELASNGATAMKNMPRSALLGDAGVKLESKYHSKEDLALVSYGSSKKDNWKNGVMGTGSAQALLNAVFYHNHKTFDIQYIDDHWNLRAENFAIHTDVEEGRKYLEFTPSVNSMMVATGKASGVQVLPKRIDADATNEESVFNIYEKYLRLIPKFGPFYRHPVDPTIVDRSIKFSDQWVGKNRLRAMLKHLIDNGSGIARHRALLMTGSDRNSPSFNGYVPPLIQLPRQSSDLQTSSLHEKLGIIKPLPTTNGKMQYSSSNPDAGSTPPSPKRSRLDEMKPGLMSQSEPSSRSPPRSKSPCITFDGEVVSNDSTVPSDKLEIAVPKSIKSVTILKGSRKITIQLD